MSYVPIAEKGVASGVATLDLESKLPPAQLPDLSTTYAPVSTTVPKWVPATAYTSGQQVVSPNGDVVSAIEDHTAGPSFSLSKWNVSRTYVPSAVVDTSQTAQTVQIAVASGSTKNALRVVNNAATYALKVDQYATSGVHDTLNIAANFTGGHTPFSVNSNNTTMSTVKIVNAAAQTGGAVIVGVASDPTRTAQVIQADNYGAGASFLATQEPGATGVGVQIQYLDAGSETTVYGTRALWIAGRHTSGSLAYIQNDKVHTSGNLLQLVQANASSTAPCLEVSPFGTGAGIKINTSGSSNLIIAGNFAVDSNGTVRSPSIINNAAFSNSRIQLTTTGTLVDRSVADNNPVLRVKNSSADSSGDVLQAIGIAGTIGSRFNKDAYFITSKATAPADADLGANEVSIWFDSTNGAAKLMIKAKQADGAVKTGSVALA